MERLVTVKDMAERYGCSMKTARTYLRRMFHYEDPLVAPKWALDEWEKSRERMPQGSTSRQRIEIERRKTNNGRIIVPRKREG